jgi:hypothetical protein
MRQLTGLTIDLQVIGFALLLAVVVALVCGAVPAWRGASVAPQDALRGGRGGGASRGHHRALQGLVVLEIALSLVLLIGAGLTLKAFAGLLRNDPGFDASRILTMQVITSATRCGSWRGWELPRAGSGRDTRDPRRGRGRRDLRHAIPGVGEQHQRAL